MPVYYRARTTIHLDFLTVRSPIICFITDQFRLSKYPSIHPNQACHSIIKVL